jgi:Double zinc ribbon/Adenylate and Guanylate cyclase catalytic domain
MRCSKCGAENPVGKRFCGDCGAPLANFCPKCRADNPAGRRFCGECGNALGVREIASGAKPNDSAIRVTDAVGPEHVDGERKTVTALFADIKGSTELEQDLDPEEARAIIAEIYNWFTEGFHTADLKDAKALFDELNG